jgi:hypothetical protein
MSAKKNIIAVPHVLNPLFSPLLRISILPISPLIRHADPGLTVIVDTMLRLASIVAPTTRVDQDPAAPAAQRTPGQAEASKVPIRSAGARTVELP